MITERAFYFYAGTVNALAAFAVIPIRTTSIAHSPFAAHFAGSAPSFFGVQALIMLVLAAAKPVNSAVFRVEVLAVTAGTLIHEILQRRTASVFDYFDLAAILLGFIAFCLIHILLTRLPETEQ